MSELAPARPRPLRVRFGVVALLYAAGLYIAGGWLPLPAAQMTRWGAAAALFLIFQLVMLWLFLPANHRPSAAAVLPTLGLGNGLTLTRGLLLGLLAGFLVIPEPGGWVAWLPMALYTTADLLDFCDGLAARLTNHVTALGEKLDMELDALGIGVVVLLVIVQGKAGWWFLVVALARYLFVIGLWWRRRQGRPIYPLPESRYRRLIAGYNMGFLSVALWPIMTPGAVAIGAAVFVTPLLLIFWRDWLVASGRLQPENPVYLSRRGKIQRWGAGWLPAAARLAIAVTAVTTGVWPVTGRINPDWTALLASWGWSAEATRLGAIALGILALLTLIPVVLGVWARWLALVSLLPVALEVIGRGVTWGAWDSVLLGGAVCVVVILNSGQLSLALPEEGYMYRRLGGDE